MYFTRDQKNLVSVTRRSILFNYYIINMKWFLLFLTCFNLSVQAQEMNFEQTVSFIQQKVQCCSVPYSASTSRKVDSIYIERNGKISLFYSDKKPALTFNIFELYNDDEDSRGIDTIMGGKFIQFYIDEEKIRMIRFANANDAGQVYDAFLKLYHLCSKEVKMFNDLNFKQTIDVINIRLAKWAESGSGIQLNANQNGDVIISNKTNQVFSFNFFNLARFNEGVEVEVCDIRRHAPRACINFRNPSVTTAFIRLECNTPEAELKILRAAILHLKSLCNKT